MFSSAHGKSRRCLVILSKYPLRHFTKAHLDQLSDKTIQHLWLCSIRFIGQKYLVMRSNACQRGVRELH